MRGWSLVKGGRWEPFVGLSDPARVLGPRGALRTGLPFAVVSGLVVDLCWLGSGLSALLSLLRLRPILERIGLPAQSPQSP